jgi:hypothetical protein
MATYYWIGTGAWDNANTANWAASSGGTGPAGPPLATDAVIFDAASGSGTCTVGSGATALTMTMTGSTITLAFGTNKITLAGSGSVFTGVSTVTVSGTPNIELSYASTLARTITTASATTEANSINFTITGGSGSVTTSPSSAVVRDLIFGVGFTGTLNNSAQRVIYGNFTTHSGMTVSGSSALLFRGASSGTPVTITTGGKSFGSAITFGGAFTTAVIQLGDSFTTTSTLTMGTCTFNLNGFNVTSGAVNFGALAKVLTLGSGTWTCSGNWDANTNGATLTVSASTATIKMTSATAKAFSGGGKTWPTLDQAGAGALTINQSNGFTDITSSYTATAACTITFTAATTQTITQFTASGTSGKLLTLNSGTPGSRFILSDSSGTNSVSYCSITDSRATGGASWSSQLTNGNVDGGNNSGWAFAAPVTYSYAADFKLRSMAQRGRF